MTFSEMLDTTSNDYTEFYKRIFRHKEKVEAANTPTITSSVSCSTATSAATPCYSITITGTTFSNFNAQKETETTPLYVNKDMGIRNFGYVLNL